MENVNTVPFSIRKQFLLANIIVPAEKIVLYVQTANMDKY